MLRLVSDGDVHGDVIRGLWAKEPELDLVRVQDVGMRRASDRRCWSGRPLRSRNRHSGPLNAVGFAWERVKAGAPMAGPSGHSPEHDDRRCDRGRPSRRRVLDRG